MQHIANGSQVRLRIRRSPDGGCTAEVYGRHDCIACHIHAADNLLLRGVELLGVRGIRKRQSCTAASECSDTGLLPIKSGPQANGPALRISRA